MDNLQEYIISNAKDFQNEHYTKMMELLLTAYLNITKPVLLPPTQIDRFFRQYNPEHIGIMPPFNVAALNKIDDFKKVIINYMGENAYKSGFLYLSETLTPSDRHKIYKMSIRGLFETIKDRSGNIHYLCIIFSNQFLNNF